MQFLATDRDHRLSKSNISVLSSLRGYLAPYKTTLLCAFLALLISSATVLSFGKGIEFLIDNGFGTSKSPDLLDHALLILLVLTCLLALSTFSRFYFITYVGEHVVADMRKQIYEHIISLSPVFYETTKSGDVLSRITADTSVLQTVIGSSLSIALRNSLLLVGGIILLSVTSWKLTLLVFIILPLVIIPILFFGRKVRILSRLSQDKVALLASHAEETIYGIRTIQAFNRESFEKSQFVSHVNASLSTAMQRVKMRGFLTAIVIFCVFLSVGGVLCVGGHDVILGKMSAGQLSSFMFYSIVVAGATGALSEVFGDLQRAAGAIERIIQLLQQTSEIHTPKDPIPLPDTLDSGIVFDNISFAYSNQSNKHVIDGFDLTIKPGETIAIVGPSGAGKSTLFHLLLRFYDPLAGHISINATPIKRFNVSDLRSLYGIVPQDVMIFSGSAYENILFGNPDVSKKELYKAAEDAAALSFIEKLPDGFDTFLGEKGVRLSGGEKQRIAIARAFLKDPKILLLDEATSSLDSENETLIQAAIEKLMKGRTTLIIAHRLSTIKHADRIVVLNEGKIEAIGDHKTLLKKHGTYKRLVDSQFRN